jgi:uncharacterized membrane protein YkvA (DUF1232 family)
MIKTLSNIKYVFRMMLDKEVPLWNKAVLLFAVLYFFLPIDFIPEAVFPGLGHVDDLVILLAALNSLGDVFAGYRARKPVASKEKILREDVVEYTVKDDEDE